MSRLGIESLASFISETHKLDEGIVEAQLLDIDKFLDGNSECFSAINESSINFESLQCFYYCLIVVGVFLKERAEDHTKLFSAVSRDLKKIENKIETIYPECGDPYYSLCCLTWSFGNKYSSRGGFYRLLYNQKVGFQLFDFLSILYYNMKFFKSFDDLDEAINIKETHPAVYDVLSIARDSHFDSLLTKNTRRESQMLMEKTPKNVLLIVAGQVRDIRSSIKNWEKNLFTECDKYDVFLCSWDKEGQYLPSGKRHKDEKILGAKFFDEIASFPDFDLGDFLSSFSGVIGQGVDVDVNRLKEEFLSIGVVRNFDFKLVCEEEFNSLTNPMKMYFLNSQALMSLSDSISDYDFVVKIRPDFKFHNNIDLNSIMNSLSCLGSNSIVTETKLGIKSASLKVGDQFAIGRPKAMSKYLSTWADDYANKTAVGFLDDYIKGHFNLALHLCINNIRVYTTKQLGKARASVDVVKIKSDVVNAIKSDQSLMEEHANRLISALKK